MDRLVDETTAKPEKDTDKNSLQTTIQILKAAATSLGAGIGGYFYQAYLQDNNITISDIKKSPTTGNLQIGIDALRRIFGGSIGAAGAGIASFMVWYMIHIWHGEKKWMQSLRTKGRVEELADHTNRSGGRSKSGASTPTRSTSRTPSKPGADSRSSSRKKSRTRRERSLAKGSTGNYAGSTEGSSIPRWRTFGRMQRRGEDV